MDPASLSPLIISIADASSNTAVGKQPVLQEKGEIETQTEQKNRPVKLFSYFEQLKQQKIHQELNL